MVSIKYPGHLGARAQPLASFHKTANWVIFAHFHWRGASSLDQLSLLLLPHPTAPNAVLFSVFPLPTFKSSPSTMYLLGMIWSSKVFFLQNIPTASKKKKKKKERKKEKQKGKKEGRKTKQYITTVQTYTFMGKEPYLNTCHHNLLKAATN